MAPVDHPSPLSPTLQKQLIRLRQLNTQNIQESWHCHVQDIPPSDVFTGQTTPHWPIAPLNDKQHIAWEKGFNTIWLSQRITVPPHIQGYPLTGLTLRLALTWWANDAQIYVDGHLVQSGDLFECFTRLCLCDRAQPGQTFHIAIRLVSPGHDNGALVRSHLTYEMPTGQPTPEPSFVADELTVLATLEPTSQSAIKTALQQLQWQNLNATDTPSDQSHSPDNALELWQDLSTAAPHTPTAAIHPFQQSLSTLRRTLKAFSPAIKQHQIQCIGHAHLDMAWLWPIADTWDAAERTFCSVLNLQKDFPELTYTHSSPALFDWLENNRPELFKQIQSQVKEGRWSIDAGLWIEPEFNIISGEAIARHILYGQRYCQEKFGTISTIAWLPDSFGFCWQLPQLLTQGGITTFATLKLSWNDTTEFPHQLFWWQSPDGSRILSLMLPPIGTDVDPVKMANHAAKWENNTQITNTLWLPGLGDHGGGPTRDMLEKSRRWAKSPFFPTLNFTSVKNYINQLTLEKSSPYTTDHKFPKDNEPKTSDISHSQASLTSKKQTTQPQTPPSETNQATITGQKLTKPKKLPVWKSDLYLELHRGCYTTHAEQKRHNRHCEDLLYQAEVFATIAYLVAGQTYPKEDLEIAWKKLLFNQFHDILPGTSIPEVFTDANQAWQQVNSMGKRVLNSSLSAIVNTIQPPAPPTPESTLVIIFNALSWPRNCVITLPVPKTNPSNPSPKWCILNSQQHPIPCQENLTESTKQSNSHISFAANNLPALGYKCYWLCPSNTQPVYTKPQEYILENKFLKATVDPKTGYITSLIEQSTQTETFSCPGNQLQAFQDKGQYWDAWNIAPDYKQHPLPSPTLESIQWLEHGPVQQRIRATYRFQSSTISQDYKLQANSPYLKVETHINWQETQILLKANFPLNITASFATYEIPFGSITRTTKPHTPAEKAQWEVPALRWADLGKPNFGTSILTNCKHGFDASPHHLRLTLLKSPIWPDPNADQGQHHFAYAIYPHPGSWQSAHTARHAREFNIPAIPHWPQVTTTNPSQQSTAHQPPERSYVQIHNPNIILSAFKPAEDDSNQLILRCYETHGENTDIQLTNTLKLGSKNTYQWVNLLETPSQKQQEEEQSNLAVAAWSVNTFQIPLKST